MTLDKLETGKSARISKVGGTGALYTSARLFLEQGDKVIYPEIAWGNYKVIAQENNLESLTYDVYDLDSLFNKIDMCDDKAFIVINSPCENPLGHSYTNDEWCKIFDKLNNSNKEIVLLIDREGNITDSDRPNCKAEHLAEEITVRLKAYVNALEKANAPLKWVKKFKRGGGK